MKKNCNNKYVNPDYYSVVIVQTLQERDSIPCKLRQNGTIAIVVEESYAQYQIQTKEGIYSVCNNNAWTQIETGDKVFDGNNLIIINNEEHKQEYLLSPLSKIGQMLFYVPENKYYKYDGADFIDPFPNKLDKPLGSTMDPDNKLIPVYGQSGDNPEWLSSNTLGKVESVNGVGVTQGTKNINLNLSDIPDNVGYATDTELTQLAGELGTRIREVEGINYTWNPTNRTLTLFDTSGRQMSQVSLVSLDNEGTDLRYNSATKSLELYNADNQLLDSIPVLDFVGNVGTALQLNSNTLQLKDFQGNILSSVSFSVSNISGLQSLLDSKLDKTTITVAAPDTTFKYAYLADEDNNVRRMLAGDLGKNIANSNLTSVAGAGMTLGAPYILTTNGQPFSVTGLADKSADSTFDRFKVQNSTGVEAVVTNPYQIMKKGFGLMTTSQALELGQLLNGGSGSSGAMSVNLISPPIIQNRFNTVEYILLRGANLNLSATSSSIQILASDRVTVLITIPNNQIQINANGTELVFFYNFHNFAQGKYFIKIISGVKTYITTIDLTVVQQIENIDTSAITWDINPVIDAGTTHRTTTANGASFSITNPTGSNSISSFLGVKSSELFAKGDDFYVEIELNISQLQNVGGSGGATNLNYLGLGYSSSLNNNIINSLVNISYRSNGVNSIFLFNNGSSTRPETYSGVAVTLIFIKTGNLFRTIFDGVQTSKTLSNNSGYSLFFNFCREPNYRVIQGIISKAFKLN